MKSSNWRITVLVDNYVKKSGLRGEHGLSLLIEDYTGKNHRALLFDTGQTPEVLLFNAAKLKVDWAKLEAIALSHGHYDHTGGLLKLMRLLVNKVPVIYHPDIFGTRINTKHQFKSIGTPFTEHDLKNLGVPTVPSRSEVHITGTMIMSGEIPRVYQMENESVQGFTREWDREYIRDTVIDDKSLILVVPGKGFFLVCGCCHAGILNTLIYAEKISKEKRLLGIVGGFHMANSSQERMDKTIEKLKEYNPSVIIPLHCTGPKESAILFDTFGNKVHFSGAGDIFYL